MVWIDRLGTACIAMQTHNAIQYLLMLDFMDNLK